MDSSDEIKRLVLAGDKIGAIRLYREQTQVGLAEAKSAVEQLQNQLLGFVSAEFALKSETPAHPVSTAAIAEALFAGNKIAAIKLYREQAKVGLAEAKRAVEEIEKQLRLSAPGLFTRPAFGKSCLPALIIVAALGVALWKLLH